MTEHGVVVGVAMGEDDTAALRFAAESAGLIGAGVTLVHAAYLPLPPPPPSPLQEPAQLLDIGRSLIRAAARRYEELTGRQCRPLVEEGPPVWF